MSETETKEKGRRGWSPEEQAELRAMLRIGAVIFAVVLVTATVMALVALALNTLS